jgi:hypothetical protein
MANFVDSANKYRKTIGQLLSSYEELIAINEEYVAIDVGSNVSDSDFADITAAEFTAGVAAAQTIITTIAANDTNLYTASDGSQR